MNKTKVGIKLNVDDASTEIVLLKEYLKEQNIKGIIYTIKEEKPIQGTMSFNDYMPLIQLTLGSAATAATVKGIFDVVKSYFDIIKQKYTSKTDFEKENLKQSKVEFTFEEGDKKVTLNFSSFNDTERNKFFETVNEMLEEKN